MKLETTPIILILTAEVEGNLHRQALASSSMYHNLLKIRPSPIFAEQGSSFITRKYTPQTKICSSMHSDESLVYMYVWASG